jgi:hypothetical protein
MEMNERKVRNILDFVRRQGQLPTDQFGQILPVDDLMSWFGLDERLSPAEKRQVRLELAVMTEAQQSLEELRMAEQLRLAGQS